MREKNKFKLVGVITSIVNPGIIMVKLETNKEVLAIASAKVRMGMPELQIGNSVVVVTNPYEEGRVKLHVDTWGGR